jgi:ferric-dicitrate binding protein FerR (iron transport regulator)
MKLILCGAAFLFAALVMAPRLAAEGKTAQVSALEGSATKAHGGASASLKVGAPLAQGDTVETADDSRLELKFSDASVLRMGSKAKLQLTEAHFGGGPAKRKMTAKLFFGNLWAKVTSVIQGEQKFQVETENAVAGVRGTTFRVDAHTDKSVLVRVYAGSVAVAKNVPIYATGKPGEQRHEVQGPEEVSREQWEKLVGKQMQIFIAADGTPGDPEKFAEDVDKDDAWAKWNQQRDEAGK